MEFPVGTVKLTLGGTFPADGAVPADYLITLDALAETRGSSQPTRCSTSPTRAARPRRSRAQIDDIIADLPTVTLKDPAGYAAEQKEQIDLFLNIIYALLGLAIIIAVLGIVNTLALSVIERTREVGLLRAIGMQRRQLRRMIRLESVAIALLGAVLGHGDGRGLRRRAAACGRRPGHRRAVDPVGPAADLRPDLRGGRRAGGVAAVPPSGQAGRAHGDHDRVVAAKWLPRTERVIGTEAIANQRIRRDQYG